MKTKDKVIYWLNKYPSLKDDDERLSANIWAEEIEKLSVKLDESTLTSDLRNSGVPSKIIEISDLENAKYLTLSDDLKPNMGSFNKDNIRQYVKSLSPAFELIIDREADYSNINPLTMIADNAWCSGIVLGKELPNWEQLDLDVIKSQLLWNNEPAQDSMIKDANPLESLSWVTNLLLSHGRTIPKNSVIITGSVIKTRAPHKGDTVIYKVGDLSEVEIKII